ncbi:MAG: hypothetical protein ABI851_16105 [Saprospiraceae bacterium]
MPFNTSVFINCPFDKAYKKLLRLLIFTCIYCGLEPKLSELKDSGSARVDGIIDLIKSSKYSIHDLSRMKSKEANELARFNMPFELGLELGVRVSGEKDLSTKVCLIIDSEKFRINIALSDLAGSDISSYGKTHQVEKIIKIIRDWFTAVIGPGMPASSFLYLEFVEFISDLQIDLEDLQYGKNAISNLPTSEYIDFATRWISNRPA